MLLLPEMPVQEPAEISRKCSAGCCGQLGQAVVVLLGKRHRNIFFLAVVVLHKITLFYSR
jgi:hypothetical protein